MTYIIIAIVLVLAVVVIGGLIALHNHVDKTAKDIMVRFSAVNSEKALDRNQNSNENA